MKILSVVLHAALVRTAPMPRVAQEPNEFETVLGLNPKKWSLSLVFDVVTDEGTKSWAGGPDFSRTGEEYLHSGRPGVPDRYAFLAGIRCLSSPDLTEDEARARGAEFERVFRAAHAALPFTEYRTQAEAAEQKTREKAAATRARKKNQAA